MAAEKEALPVPGREVRAEEGRRQKELLPGFPQRTSGNEGEGVSVVGVTPRPFVDALELVRAASQALERMRARCREVETYASRQADYYLSEMAVAETGLQELQRQSVAQEEEHRQLEKQLRSAAAQRRELEEALMVAADMSKRQQELLRELEERALTAGAWLSRLQGEIASAFGDVPSILAEFSPSDSHSEHKLAPLRQG
jgi:hypothetical protein